MEKFVEQTFLFDFYGELLTERQRQVYTSVVFEDYSLSEVAEELGISRQGVHDMIKRCNKTLVQPDVGRIRRETPSGREIPEHPQSGYEDP